MAVNQSPMYQKAEERYRSASSPADKVAALEEMYRLVPKHKASEKLQASLKQKLKHAREEMQKGSAAKHSGGQHDLFQVPKQGAGQVALLGEANTGKSSIVGALTSAKVEIAEFPFSTHAATPGMAHHEDVPIQLVDMPPLMDGHAQPGMIGAFRSADCILMVIDLSALDLIDQFQRPLAWLTEHRMKAQSTADLVFEEDEESALPKRLIVAANKSDTPGAADNLEGLKELVGTDLKIIPVSAKSSDGLGEMLSAMFSLLNVVRVYAKKPGKPADKEAPFILPIGATVHDMAHLIHRDLAEKLKGARIWGGTVHDGQQVHATHVLTDKNVVELHFP